MDAADPASDEYLAVLDELHRMPICEPMRRCDPEGLSALARLGRIERLATGTVVFNRGEAASDLRVVVSGRIALSFDLPGQEPKTVGSTSRGDLLGWSALRRGGTWTVSARATKPTQCLVFPGAAVLDLCEADPRFGYCMMLYAFDVVAQRLADARVQLLDLYGRNP